MQVDDGVIVRTPWQFILYDGGSKSDDQDWDPDAIRSTCVQYCQDGDAAGFQNLPTDALTPEHLS